VARLKVGKFGSRAATRVLDRGGDNTSFSFGCSTTTAHDHTLPGSVMVCTSCKYAGFARAEHGG
jgi:hypothetical protein